MANKTGEYLNERFEDSLVSLVWDLSWKKRRTEFFQSQFEELQKLIECKAEVDSSKKKITIRSGKVVEKLHELLEYYSQLFRKLGDLKNHIKEA